tara:strand:+ start:122 stop:2437 length:2316 start_codon:yes stop_codon:yes gene_type:complete
MHKLPLTPHIQGVLRKAGLLAKVLKRNGVDIDLFFHCFINDLSLSCSAAFNNLGLPLTDFLEASDQVVARKRRNKNTSISLKADVKRLLKESECIASETLALDYISPEVILMAFFDEDHCPKVIKDHLPEDKKTADKLIVNIVVECSSIAKDLDLDCSLPLTEDSMSQNAPDHWIDMFEENEILSQFAENLNLRALTDEFDKIVDFDGKLDELATILCRKKKPNAILVGPAGTGKTSLVEALAARIVSGDAPELIANKVIYSVSLSSMVAGTEYRGQFEKRLEDFVNEAKKYSNLILFIDEVHTLIGAGGATNNSLEASNILKPELARGTISCIGATTINEYTNTIKKDTALDRRFERVVVREPSKFQMQQILPTIVSYYEDFHGVEFTPEFLDNVIDFCEKYLPNKFYPDKAIDVIDHCGAQAKVNFWQIDPSLKEAQAAMIKSTVEAEDNHSELLDKLNKSIKKWTKKITTKAAKVKLHHLKDFFAKKVNPLNDKKTVDKIFKCIGKSFVGQNDVITKLRDKIVIHSIGLEGSHDFSSPDCFVISGQKLSGKSLFTELFENSLRKHGVNVLSYNGVHFSDAAAPHKLASSQGNNTSVCEKITMYPNSVLIIDDFHKIDPLAVPIFNQILKEGKFQMNNGEIADFSNCKIFLTSALASGQPSMGFQTGEVGRENLRVDKNILPLVDECFFLNKLTQKDLRRLLWTKLKTIKKNLEGSNINLTFDFKFICNAVREIDKEKFRIRALNDKIAKEITPLISEKILNGKSKIRL